MADLSDDRNLPSADDVSVVFDETQVPEDEREDILKEIEARVSETQTHRRLGDEHLRPQRSGVAFPIVINLVAAAAIAAGIYFISEYFRVREDTIALESRSYFSAEGQLIEEILRESEQRLAQKDEEIGQIQSQLAQLDQEKRSLEANLEDRVAAREAELRAQLDAELAAERQRLAEAGQSEESINTRLAEIEAARQSEYDDQLESFRAQAQAELDQLAAELSQREAQLEQTLEASQEERTRIAEEAAAREDELRAQYGAEIEALQEAGQEAQARIAQLQSLRQEESLLADRVLGSFAVIVGDIQEGMTDEALDGLDSLERLLRQQAPSDTDAGRRRNTELALASTLRGLVQEVQVLRDNIAVRDLTTTDQEEASLEQQRAAELIQTAAGVVQLAEDARQDGRMNEARSLYQQALATIPSLEAVYPGILELESARREAVMKSAVSDAQNLLAAGSSEAAITTYLQALTEIASGDDDPLRDVANGILLATEQNQQDLLDAQQDIRAEYQADLDENSRTIAGLNQQLLTARNQVASRDATISDLRSQVATLNQQVAAREQTLSGRAEDLQAAQARVTELEDALAAARVDLQAARTRSASLETSLATARERIAELEEREAELLAAQSDLQADAASGQSQTATLQSRIDALTAERASLQDDLQQRDAQIATLQSQLDSLQTRSTSLQDQVTTLDERAATIESLTAARDELRSTIEERDSTIDELNAQLSRLNASVAQGDTSLGELQDQIETLRASLRTAENERDSAQTDLEAANEQVRGLQEQITTLRDQRDAANGKITNLEAEVSDLTEEVTLLRAYQDRIESLTARYENVQRTAARLAAASNFASARDRLLAVLQNDTANEVLPGLVATLQQVYAGLIAQAENQTASEVRAAAFDDVTGLTEQVKKNVDDPQGSSAVQSYLRREPDIQTIANEIFEIIELASRDISAPEAQYRLLGSVSRATTGNLVVVERLVELETKVGDVVEIRRTPQLGQEVPIGLGQIIEVTSRRVVVSVDEIYQLELLPQDGDLVYLQQE